MVLNIILEIIIVLIIVILISYNALVRLKNRVMQAKSDIDIVLNQRFDLIPNIVECVKAYSKHESQTLEDVVRERNAYKSANKTNLFQAEKVNSDFNRVLAIAESYPDLKADTQYINLQGQLSIIESSLQEKRDEYNDAVTKYNTKIETVPSNIVAKMFNFVKEELFKIDDEKRKNIGVEI